jgi:hypothetical protein
MASDKENNAEPYSNKNDDSLICRKNCDVVRDHNMNWKSHKLYLFIYGLFNAEKTVLAGT